ncbi:VQ motif [Musa troglodytarum]|uniref:VQ motif n=1 Tax=Musa troglodytarum TaxID=320322 RepID=A0A9E7HWH5_9LILI|nr:VQ motif [Musa troglodytarum]
MAVNDAASSAAEWSRFDGRSVERTPSLAPAVFAPASESILVTAASSQTSGGGSATPGTEGRVARPPRRRPRPSRRAPVTLFNTNTDNFRAMVQQFTGFPSRPDSSGYRPGSGLRFGDPQMAMAPPGHFRHPQYLAQQYQPHHHHYQQQQQQYQYQESTTTGGLDGGATAATTMRFLFRGFTTPALVWRWLMSSCLAAP